MVSRYNADRFTLKSQKVRLGTREPTPTPLNTFNLSPKASLVVCLHFVLRYATVMYFMCIATRPAWNIFYEII